MIIYKATNLVNLKCYIGQTKFSLKYRKKTHLWFRKKLTCPYFHYAIKKYGKDNFKWEILCECDTKDELDEMEFHFIKQYKSYYKENGYNLTLGGGGCLEYKLTKEQIKKLSDSHKGKVFTEEHRKNISESRKGTKASEETRKKMSMVQSGENNGMYGKNHKEESRKKISDFAKTRTGEKNSNYGNVGELSKNFDKPNKNGIWVLELPDGKIEEWHNLESFCRDYKKRFGYRLSSSNLVSVSKGRLKHYKKIKCKFKPFNKLKELNGL